MEPEEQRQSHHPNKRLRASQGIISPGLNCGATTTATATPPCPSSSSSPPQITTLRDAAFTSSSPRGHHELLLLDLRPAADQRRRRLAGIYRRHPPHRPSVVIASLPLEEVKARSFELPARHVRFSILVASDDDNHTHVQTAKQFLMQPDRQSSNKSRKPRPWDVQHILMADDAFWKEAREMNLLEEESAESNRRLPRLWDADGMVETVLLPLLQKEMDSSDGMRLQVYDMASGAGRDAAFLAEELLLLSATKKEAQFHVIAIDHRYNAKQSNIVQDFFQRRGVHDVTSVVKANLSKWETMREILLSARMSDANGADGNGGDDASSHAHDIKTTEVLYCVRFLVRHAIRALASCSSLREGTIFAISHFCIAEVGDAWPFDHPSPKTVLERNEMKDLFAANGWDVILDKIATDSDHGRTLLHFIAKKR